MAIEFPTSPANGEVYTVGNRSWTWNGYGWKRKPNIGDGTIATTDYVQSSSVTPIDIGSNASTARSAGTGVQYWICDNGVTPTNAVDGDLIYNRPA